MDFRSAFSQLVNRNRPAETQPSTEYPGITPQARDGVQISVEPYTVAGHPRSFYEVSLAKDGNKLPVSSVKVKTGQKTFFTTDIIEVPEGANAYVLEVTDRTGNTYRCPKPIAVQ